MTRVVFNSRVFEKNTQQTVFTYVFTIDTWPYFPCFFIIQARITTMTQ